MGRSAEDAALSPWKATRPGPFFGRVIPLAEWTGLALGP